MMKKTRFIVTLAFAALLVTGCDFFRALGGRPTSADLEAKRQELAARAEAEHAARLDSVATIEKQLKDSLEAMEAHLIDSLSNTKGAMMTPGNLGGLGESRLATRYCIVVGAFRSAENAARKVNRCNEAGYPASVLVFKNGLNAVAVCPSDSLGETVRNLKTLRGSSVCPSDGWILVSD